MRGVRTIEKARAMRDSPRVSVAIPIHNEQEVIPALIERTVAVLDSLSGGPHEIVFVDDGSSDRSFQLLLEAGERDARIRVVKLSRNFGHQAAFGAALDHVQGDVVVLMDGDLQDPPEAIPEFVLEYQLGHDVVYAERIKRKEPLWLRSCYRAFYSIIAFSSDINMPQNAGDFGLMSRRVVDAIRSSPERHRYWRGLRSWVGYRQVGVKVERDARFAGSSKYSLRKLVTLALDGFFSFTVVPLRFVSIFGVMTVFASAMYAAYVVYAKLILQESPQGFTSLVLAMVFFAGVQLLSLGIIGEYIGRIYEQVKLRPHYLVDRVTGQACDRSAHDNAEITASNMGVSELENGLSSRSSSDLASDVVATSSISDAPAVYSSNP